MIEKKSPAVDSKEKEGKAVPEFNFEKGVLEVVRRITEILKTQPYCVVAFNGSGVNVGKTHLSKTLLENLRVQGIRAGVYYGVENVKSYPIVSEAKVFIFEQLGWGTTAPDGFYDQIRQQFNENVSVALRGKGVSVAGVDLWVGVCRPDKPLHKPGYLKPHTVLADVIINNEEAKDKKPPVQG